MKSYLAVRGNSLKIRKTSLRTHLDGWDLQASLTRAEGILVRSVSATKSGPGKLTGLPGCSILITTISSVLPQMSWLLTTDCWLLTADCWTLPSRSLAWSRPCQWYFYAELSPVIIWAGEEDLAPLHCPWPSQSRKPILVLMNNKELDISTTTTCYRNEFWETFYISTFLTKKIPEAGRPGYCWEGCWVVRMMAAGDHIDIPTTHHLHVSKVGREGVSDTAIVHHNHNWMFHPPILTNHFPSRSSVYLVTFISWTSFGHHSVRS